jgi:hypothetical protein
LELKDEAKKVCIHEAGHIFVALFYDIPILEIFISPRCGFVEYLHASNKEGKFLQAVYAGEYAEERAFGQAKISAADRMLAHNHAPQKYCEFHKKESKKIVESNFEKIINIGYVLYKILEAKNFVGFSVPRENIKGFVKSLPP